MYMCIAYVYERLWIMNIGSQHHVGFPGGSVHDATKPLLFFVSRPAGTVGPNLLQIVNTPDKTVAKSMSVLLAQFDITPVLTWWSGESMSKVGEECRHASHLQQPP